MIPFCFTSVIYFNREIGCRESTSKGAPIEMKGKSFTLQIDENCDALKPITMNRKTISVASII
jgi:hypothetical protein